MIYRDALGSMEGGGTDGCGVGGWGGDSLPPQLRAMQPGACSSPGAEGDAALLGWVCRGQIAQGTAQGDDDARRICLLEPTLKLSSRAIRAAGGSCLLQGCPGTAPSSSSPTPSSTCPTHISSPWCPTALSCPSRRILAAQRMQLSLCISSFASLPLHLSLCSSLFATLPFASLPPAALPLHFSLCSSPLCISPALCSHGPPRADFPAPIFGLYGGKAQQGRLTHLAPTLLQWGWGEVLGDAWMMPGSCIQKDVPLLLQALEVQEGGRKAISRGSAWAGSWEPGPECCRQHPGAEHSQGVGVGTVLLQP